MKVLKCKTKEIQIKPLNLRYKIVGNIFQIKIMEEIVVEMNTYTKWWDSWFVVADLTIPLFLDDYDYFNFSPVYLLTDGDVKKKEFIVKKHEEINNLNGIKWSEWVLLMT